MHGHKFYCQTTPIYTDGLQSRIHNARGEDSIKRTMKNGTEIDSDEDSDEELFFCDNIMLSKWSLRRLMDFPDSLSCRRGNTNHCTWSLIMPFPIAHRTQTKITCTVK